MTKKQKSLPGGYSRTVKHISTPGYYEKGKELFKWEVPSKPVKNNKPTKTTLYIPPALWKRAKIEAIRRGCDATDLVVQGLELILRKSKGGQQ